MVLTLINNRELAPSDFLMRAGAVTLTPEGRKTVVRAWERQLSAELRHPLFGYSVSNRQAASYRPASSRRTWSASYLAMIPWSRGKGSAMARRRYLVGV